MADNYQDLFWILYVVGFVLFLVAHYLIKRVEASKKTRLVAMRQYIALCSGIWVVGVIIVGTEVFFSLSIVAKILIAFSGFVLLWLYMMRKMDQE